MGLKQKDTPGARKLHNRIGGRRLFPRHTIWQQTVRATLHTMQFAVAYFIMLLAMSYNGYIIISIFIGAFVGFWLCEWSTAPS